MAVPFLDLKKQYSTIKEEIDARIADVLQNCNFIMGPNVAAFEKELAAYLNARNAATCASGSDALLLALMALGIKEGDEVLTTPFTFFATAGAIARLNATPVFADIDGRTFNIDPASAVKKINSRTKAIIAVHLYGQAADLAPLMKAAAENKSAVIEDCAQAIGARYGDKPVGTIGDIGCLSFFPTKNLGCYGDGGAVIAANDEIAEKIKILRVHGAKPKYFHKFIGINSRLDEIQAAVLRVKLKYVDGWNGRRKEIAALYGEAFKNEDKITVPYNAPYAFHIFHQYAIMVNNRDFVLKKLNEAKIGAGVYYPEAMHLQECFKYLNYKKGDLPVCEEVCSKILSLPIYPEMSVAEINEVCDAVLANAG
ncbi:MAG: UDP-2-acetamido-2-deoxy-3-oxo-D-glucuronate aminotransferase [bacterium ADurb.Bin243]|nr:MAG: UDP-2-acetamido-2-deoxy-3-oxo-D-glucuronate aminotransferase [bacterium ADurb.Bin243]HOD39692.1 DegT/DnrJ/EryC1/StrS family aminotransferase [Candidatus Wallbacteria bacterium]